MFMANLNPGQGFHQYTVYKEDGGISETGRAIPGTLKETEAKFYGALVNATQNEVEQWKQKGHPITHKIIEWSAMKKAEATDYLRRADGREFYVKGVKNPADFNVVMIYFVEERLDTTKRTE